MEGQRPVNPRCQLPAVGTPTFSFEFDESVVYLEEQGIMIATVFNADEKLARPDHRLSRLRSVLPD